MPARQITAVTGLDSYHFDPLLKRKQDGRFVPAGGTNVGFT
jgi:hypothetical protein